ncbi:MAG: methyltransferase domain-containing protein [Bacteroidota bacterium]
MFSKFHTRSQEEEIMDDLEMKGDLLEKTLDQLAWINVWLGGNRITWMGLKKIQTFFDQKEIKLLDLGTGGGDALRYLAKKMKPLRAKFQLIGWDANEATLAYATKRSQAFPNIAYQKANILDPKTSYKDIDVVTCALFLHHFSEDQLSDLFKSFKADTVKYLIINDLQRHWLPYILFMFVSKVLRFSKMAHHDGLLSIKRGFKKTELLNLIHQSGYETKYIGWKWAFRYLIVAELPSQKNS